MEELWRDVRFAARTLVKSPGFTLVAVTTLALGIGANTAIFSVINAILLRPLPYPQPERLVFLTEWSEQVPEMSFSIANLKDVRDQNTVFESIVGYNGQSFILSSTGIGSAGQAGQAERVNGRQVTSGLFATLGKQPVLGRAFGAEEEKPGAPGVVLLGEGFWERRFGRDQGVLGRTLVLSGEPFTVIGVMPRSMHSSWRNTEVFTPLLRLEDKIGGENNRGNHPGIYVIGRMQPGISVEKARNDVKTIAARLAERYPSSNARQSMTVEPLHEAVVGELRPALMLLLGAVAFVLLIACANVANLLLARAASRQREIAVRLALGARRSRVLRQLLTESVLLSLLGAVAGVLLGYLGLQALLASLPANVPRADEVQVDLAVLLVTAALAVLTGLAFGIVPAWRTLGVKLHEPLKEAGRGSVGPGQHRVRNGLVIAEVSMALVLLVGAGLMLRSFYRVLHADAGFRPEGLVIASVALPETGYGDHPKRAVLFDKVLAELKARPGVKAAAATLPLLGGWQSGFSVEGKPEPPPGQRPSADIARVSPDYFSVMGIRVLAGRVFEERDREQAPKVCVVDETFARTHWPGESPLGKRVKFGALSNPDSPWMEVVGEVAHVKNYGVDEKSRVELYLPYLQSSGGGFTLVVRTESAAAVAADGIRAAMRAADPELPLHQIRALDELVAERSAERRLAAQLISVFATLALVLAAVGIYGVMSYAVAQRTQEIGIRMALGAGEESILQMVLRNGATLALAGVAIGLAAALLLARLISSLLFQTSAADPPTFGIVPLLLLAVALLASYWPARRAARVDPMTALRHE